MKKKITNYRYRAIMSLESLSQQDSSQGVIFSQSDSSSALCKPAEIYFDLPDNSKLSEEFRKNHPRLYHVLNTKLFQNYHGL